MPTYEANLTEETEVQQFQSAMDAAIAEANADLEAWEDDEAWRNWLDSGAGGFI